MGKPAVKGKKPPPPPSDDEEDDYGDEDTYSDEENTKGAKPSKFDSKAMKAKFNDVTAKVKSGATSGMKQMNTQFNKLKTVAKHAVNGSDDDGSDFDDDADNANDYAKARQQGKQQQKGKPANGKSQYQTKSSTAAATSKQRNGKKPPPSDDDEDDHSAADDASHSDDDAENEDSTNAPAPAKRSFFSWGNNAKKNGKPTKQSSAASSDNESAANSRRSSYNGSVNEQLESIDIDVEDGDLSTLYYNTPKKYKYMSSEVQVIQRKRALLQWQQEIDTQQLLPEDATNINSILAFRRVLLEKRNLVRNGLPGRLRSVCWQYLSGAQTLPDRLEAARNYVYWLDQARKSMPKTALKDIKNDLSRTLNAHPYYLVKQHQTTLKHLLCAFVMSKPEVGYCNSMSHLVGFMMLFYPTESESDDNIELENIYWLFVAMIDIVLPPAYYDRGLVGSRADAQLLKTLVFQRLPKLHQHFVHLQLDIYVLTLKWFMCLYTVTLPLPTVMRIWDVLLLEGPTILISVAVALLALHQKQLLLLTETDILLTTMDQLLKSFYDVDQLFTYIHKYPKICAITREDLIQRNTERKIMEAQYMKELQYNVRRREVQAEIAAEQQEQQKDEMEEMYMYLQVGIDVWKIPYTGQPKKTKLRLLQQPGSSTSKPEHWYLEWESKKKKNPDDARMKLNECMIFTGIEHGLFHKRHEMGKKYSADSHLALSIISPNRSLDLVCTSEWDYEQLLDAMKRAVPSIAAALKKNERVEEEL